MAPMTRMRTTQPGNLPNELMARQYAQRAKTGLIIGEAAQISPQGQGYSWTPGIHDPAQIEGWKLVTRAVHEAGGRMFCQLWHVGRMSHPSFHKDGKPVAPSAIAPGARIWLVDEKNPRGGMAECPVPRALERSEIPGVVEDYRRAAENAMEAGFDGVEIHGANGYLIDQFLRRTSNKRDDEYGGPLENRARFALEVARAVSETAGPERTGIRLAPFVKQRGMDDPQAVDAVLYLAEKLDGMGLVYMHIGEADWDDAPQIPLEFREKLRRAFSRAIIVAGNYDVAKAERFLGAGLVDLVAFGRPFVANPDLPERLFKGLPLRELDKDKLYGGGAEGYIYED